MGEMNATALRPVRPARFRRGHTRRTVETLLEQIRVLASERQLLRDSGASRQRLERNRIKLARAQWELSHALIARHLPEPDHSQAA